MRVLKPIAHFTYRARVPLLVLFALLFVAAAAYGSGAAETLTVGGFDDPASESSRAERRLEERFGAGQPDVVVAYSHPSARVTDEAFRRALEPALTRIAETPGVERVATPYGTNPTALVSEDGRTVVVSMALGADGAGAQSTFEAIERHLRPTGLEAVVGGTIPASREAQEAAESDLRRAELITLPLLAVLLVVFFRGVVLASLPLLIGGFAVSAALALVRLATHVTEVSIFAMNIVTFVGLGVAVDYALFMAMRFRDELHAGYPIETAIHHTLMTAGRTIGYSGLAVMASLLGMLAFPMMLLRSVAVAGTAVVFMALVAALVFLPAGLAVLGHRIDWLGFGRGESKDAWTGPLGRLSELAMRAPVVTTLAGTAFLLFLGSPFLHMRESVSGAAVLPHHADARRFEELLRSDRFPPYATTPIDVVVRLDEPALSSEGLARIERFADVVAAIPGVGRVDAAAGGTGDRTAAALSAALARGGPSAEAVGANLARMANGEEAYVRVGTRAPPESDEAAGIVRAIRGLDVEGAYPEVAGRAARLVDLRATMADHLPRALAVVCLATFVVLFLAFGSVVMPIKAILMNCLSLTASFGALVFIFQDGRFEELLGFRSPGSIELTVPVVMFAVVFGLAMDYELFLLSRIREAYDHTGDTRSSVVTGLAHTGKLITRAALLLVAVMLGFISADMLLVKELGVGMAIAIAIDATIVRLFLVPATMQLLGRYNWWAPAFLERLWRRSGLGVDERDPEELADDTAPHPRAPGHAV